MLTITVDDAHNCLLVEPEGRLTETDFEKLTESFNTRANESDSIPNLVIHAKGFPGWADFGGLAGHLSFVRDHHKLIRKIALVSDARILDMAPQIAGRFLQADIRHFAGGDLEAALDWVGAAETDLPAVTLMDDLPGDVLGVEVRGTVTARDYESVIVPKVERMLKDHAKIRLLYYVTPDLKAISPGAMFADARLGMVNLTRFSRIALVADQDWMRNSLRMFGPFIPGEVRVFTVPELDAAKAWVTRPETD